jgi:hypothetical protein
MLLLVFLTISLCVFPLICFQVKGAGWNIDLFSGNGGHGKNIPSKPFAVRQRIFLFAYVTYNQEPVISVLVSFQVDDPKNSSRLVSTAQTNSSGYAVINFTLTENSYPPSPDFWTAVATTSPAQETVIDTMPFCVLYNVGGFSHRINEPIYVHSLLTEILLLTVFVAIVGACKHYDSNGKSRSRESRKRSTPT